MSTATVPDLSELVDAKVRWAARYVEVGWKVFVLGRDKTPLPNCQECHNTDWSHDREKCRHLTCHGFYAATDRLDAVQMLVSQYPDGWLAVRTGAASRLLVLDFEAAPDREGVTGLDTLDQWEMWTGTELPPTLRQRTQSGGLHLLYRLPLGKTVKSLNRVLPQTDVKAEGGYVAVPTPGRPERRWLPWREELRTIRDVPGSLLDALEKLRGRSRGGGSSLASGGTLVAGYDYQAALRDGCPGGMRDQFFNDLLFRTRKAGVSREGGVRIARMHWERCEQPPATEWYMPWEHVEYKLDRIWQTVEPPPPTPSWRPTAQATASQEHIIEAEVGAEVYRRGGRVIRRRTT